MSAIIHVSTELKSMQLVSRGLTLLWLDGAFGSVARRTSSKMSCRDSSRVVLYCLKHIKSLAFVPRPVFPFLDKNVSIT